MARKGLLKQFRPTDLELARHQDNVRDALDVLTADDDLVTAPTVRLVASAAIAPGSTIVVFSGGASGTVTLPAANARGMGVGFVLFVMNVSTVTVTLVPSRGDTLNGASSLSLGAGKLAICVGDGSTTWKAVTS